MMLRKAMQSPAALQESTQSPLLVVSFELGSQRYGLPVTVVREVIRLPALITLAGAPPAMCGLLNLRGQYIPVLDGRVLVGEPSCYDLMSQIMIIGHPDTLQAKPVLGLLADRVLSVDSFAQA